MGTDTQRKPSMSPMGHEPKYGPDGVASALPATTDIPSSLVNVGLVPGADIACREWRGGAGRLVSLVALVLWREFRHHVVEIEGVEHCRYRPVPIAGERGTLLFEHRALSRSFKGNNAPALLLERGKDREELLDIAVETAEHDERAVGSLRWEGPCRQPEIAENNLSS